MANSPRPLTPGAWALSGALAALVLGTALALALRADNFTLRPAEWAALSFTLKQAALSALFATLLAVPVARALARRQFPGRGAMVALMGAPFLLPVVVAVIGILSVYGRNGVVNQLLAALGLPTFSIFGLQGVVLTNVFFDLPLATRIILNGWLAIPAERFRLAETLNLGPAGIRRHLEYPMLREVLPGALTVIFLLCLTSFVVSLTFGGGPKATTLELAIYQALRFDFDLGRAALLAALQFLTCAIAVTLAGRLTLPSNLGTGHDRPQIMRSPGGITLAIDAVFIAITALFLSLPLIMVLKDGFPALPHLSVLIWQSALRSLLIALTGATLATAGALTLTLAVAQNAKAARWIEVAAMLPMAASGLVLGTGLFLVVRPFTTPESLALPVTVLVNAALALPFLYRAMLPEARALYLNYDRLCTTLNVKGFSRLRLITLPRLARPLGFGAGIAAALSMGDLGVIALFAGDHNATLPLMVQRLAGAYRMEDAAAASLLLVAISFALFWAFDQGGRPVAH
ncbi:MAG: thiamine/thiamine pyrophosphate ABC transporter permease ThiP [Paracoccaceae bacterium]